MKKLLALIIVLVVALGISPRLHAQTTRQGAFKFDEEKHDFGKIPQGKPTSFVFWFTNVGEEALIISSVNSSCGCIKPEYTKSPIRMGDKGWVKVTYNAASAGVFTKTITVTSNTQALIKVLTVTGQVIP